MANKTRFTVELLDRLSKPSKQIGQALDSLASRGPALQKSLGGGLSGVGVAGVAMGNFVAAGAARAVGAIGELVASSIGAVKEFTVFAQNSELAFNALAKHGASGAKLFAHARDLAVEFGMDVRDTSDSFRKLLAAQFDPRLATDIIKMGADLRSIGGSAEDVKGAVRAISQIKGTGILQGDELNQLAEAGLSINLIRENIGKLLGGKSVSEVLKLQEAGKINADVAVQGILAAVREKTGSKELGEAGKRFADTTLEGMGGRLLAKGQNLMVDLGNRMVPVVSRFAGPIADRLSAFLASPEAQAGIDRFVAGVEKGFTFVSVALEKAWPLAQRFGSAFLDKIAPALPGIVANAQGFLNALDRPEVAAAIERWGERFGRLGAMLLQIGGFALRVIPDILVWVDAIQRPFDKVNEVAQWLIGKATEWGPAIIQGLANGIAAGVDKVAAAAQNVANAVKGRFQKVFDFGSPSKVMEQRGLWVSEGFQIGMDKLAPAPSWLGEVASNDFGPRASSFSAMTPVAAGGSGMAVTYAPVYEITQQPGQSADELVDELSERNRRDFEDWLEDIAVAAGA